MLVNELIMAIFHFLEMKEKFIGEKHRLKLDLICINNQSI